MLRGAPGCLSTAGGYERMHAFFCLFLCGVRVFAAANTYRIVFCVAFAFVSSFVSCCSFCICASLDAAAAPSLFASLGSAVSGCGRCCPLLCVLSPFVSLCLLSRVCLLSSFLISLCVFVHFSVFAFV